MQKEYRLERRGRIYYLRVVIPASLRPLYPGRKSRVIRVSLKTSDRPPGARRVSASGESRCAWRKSSAQRKPCFLRRG